MKNYSKYDVVLIKYPFTDLSGSKVRPAVIVSSPHPSHDIFIVPLTSKTASLFPGEFILADWHGAGLNVRSVVKRGIYTINHRLIIKTVGILSAGDMKNIDRSLRKWLGCAQNAV